jgi:hypothetical protein
MAITLLPEMEPNKSCRRALHCRLRKIRDISVTYLLLYLNLGRQVTQPLPSTIPASACVCRWMDVAVCFTKLLLYCLIIICKT